jgi:hypothetical protein
VFADFEIDAEFYKQGETVMRKLALAAVAAGALSLVSVAPAQARWVHRGWGPGIGFGLAAGTLAFGAAATAPYYYGPNYYYGPAYGPDYYPAPYAYGPVYYGRPYYYRGPYW